VFTQTRSSLADKRFAYTASYVLSVMMFIQASDKISLLLQHIIFNAANVNPLSFTFIKISTTKLPYYVTLKNSVRKNTE
jgi:hypothetical protein